MPSFICMSAFKLEHSIYHVCEGPTNIYICLHFYLTGIQSLSNYSHSVGKQQEANPYIDFSTRKPHLLSVL
jgi:hypothetical protein